MWNDPGSYEDGLVEGVKNLPGSTRSWEPCICEKKKKERTWWERGKPTRLLKRMGDP